MQALKRFSANVVLWHVYKQYQMGVYIGYMCNMFVSNITVIKLRTICHPRDLENIAQFCKHYVYYARQTRDIYLP